MASNPSDAAGHDPGLDPERLSSEALNDEKSAWGADFVSGSHVDEVRVGNKEDPISSFDGIGKKEGDSVIDGGSDVKGDSFVLGQSTGNDDSVVGGENVVKDDSLVALKMNESKESGVCEKEENVGSDDSLENKESVVKDESVVEGENVVKDDSLVALEMKEGKETDVCEKEENAGSGDSVEKKESVVNDESVVEGENVVKDGSLVAFQTNESKESGARDKEENVGFGDSVEDKESVAKDESAYGNQGLVSSEMMVEKSEGEDNMIREKEGLDKEEEIDAMETDETVFSFNDLVWGKIKSHPWWPGQIFDPKYASEMALKCQKKDHLLVAYFGDKTFAWCHESQLKPFQENFSQMAKQSIMVPFVNAVVSALQEYSRRVELGFACNCLAGETYDNLKHLKVENAGVKEGTCNVDVGIPFVADSFQPKSFVEHVLSFAECPYEGVDRLELATTLVLLKVFYRLKGHPELPVYDAGGLLLEDNGKDQVLHKSSEKGNADGLSPVALDTKSGKRSRGRPRKDIAQTNADVRKTGSKVKKDPDSADLGASKKRRLDKKSESEGGETPSSTRRTPLKIGDHISRVASKLQESRLTLSAETEKKSATKRKSRGGKTTGDNSLEAAMKEDVASNSADELLSQLCVLARDPMVGHTAPPSITTFFRDYSDYRSVNSGEGEEPGKSVRSKRGRKPKVDSGPVPKTTDPDYMQDSYWSDIIFHSSPEREPASSGRKRKRGSRKNTKLAGEHLLPLHGDASLDQVDATNPADKQGAKAEGIINSRDEKTKEETPTTLILSFDKPESVPSAAELIRIFSPFGPLKEEDTEVLKKSSRAKVVFKYQEDAENAFTSAGKYSAFGSALVSYRLKSSMDMTA